jgi:AAA domain, putative AbiEii toxin, Type IV TA system
MYSGVPIMGVYIRSHRPVFSYAPVTSIPTNPRGRNEAYNDYSNVSSGGYSGKTPIQSLKESLISMAAFGYGNQVIVANSAAKDNFERFQLILTRLLPKSIGFKKISINMPEVILETESGRFTIDSVSGGLASLIDLAWKIFTFAPEIGEFVVAIDEPENHLHPELQKSILIGLTEAFPEAQFIIVTHSPFIISSYENAKIYALRFDENKRIYSEYLNLIEKAATSNEILKDVLGIESTLPLWAEDSLNEIVKKYQQVIITDTSLDSLRRELEEGGLGSFVPDAMMAVIRDED